MKRLVIITAAVIVATAMAAPAWACQGEHGYSKTKQALNQSTLPAEKKASLMEMIQKSQAAHDKYTATGEWGKMSQAVSELAEVNQHLGK